MNDRYILYKNTIGKGNSKAPNGLIFVLLTCRDPCTVSGAVQMPGAAVGVSNPAPAGLTGVLPQESRDSDGIFQEPG